MIFLHRFCEELLGLHDKYSRLKDLLVTNGVYPSVQEPPCPQLEMLRNPKHFKQPQLSRLTTEMITTFFVSFKVKNRYGDHKGKYTRPGVRTFAWFTSALSKAFMMAGLNKPDRRTFEVSSILKGIKTEDAEKKQNIWFIGSRCASC